MFAHLLAILDLQVTFSSVPPTRVTFLSVVAICSNETFLVETRQITLFAACRRSRSCSNTPPVPNYRLTKRFHEDWEYISSTHASSWTIHVSLIGNKAFRESSNQSFPYTRCEGI